MTKTKIIDYEFKRGDTAFLEKFRPNDLNGIPLTLSADDNIYFTMKQEADGQAILKKKINNGITYEEDGYFHITLEPQDTANLSAETYKYDIELVLQSFEPTYVKTLIEGEITLLQDITKEGDRV
ncbi:MAG: hypothetical protein IKL68_02215 [Clostridia bacterium]|nr:hypothetical protein [Clostridia bacterium]